MKNKVEIQQDRDKIKNIAGKVIGLFNEINDVMEKIPHRNGTAIKSLKPRSLEYLSHGSGGIIMFYRHSDGKLYEITYKEVKEK